MEITIIVMKINIITTISIVMIIIAINATKILEEITKITTNNPGDWVELLFVGAGRLSSAGRGGQADDQRGRWGGIINVYASGIEADIYHQTDENLILASFWMVA